MPDIKNHKLFLAPMAEITTPVFRRCIRKFSRETVIYSEMISAAAICRGGINNEYFTHVMDEDQPFVFQILGGDPELMAESCVILSGKGCSGIDINMGCSAPDIIKKFQGARLLSEPDTAAEIVRRCRKAYNGSLSVKMRSGFSDSDRAYLTGFAQMLETEGVDYIAIHPRHGRQSFKRTADWSLVRLLTEKLNIPVIGNGDINTPEEILLRLNETGCSGIMVGRGAITSPWIFAAGEDLMSKGYYRIEVDLLDLFTDIINEIQKFFPLQLHKSRAHRFSIYFTKNFIYSHDLFKKIRNMDRIELIIEIIRDYIARNPHERIRIFSGGDTDGIFKGVDRA